MSLIDDFRNPNAAKKETITSLKFYGVYCGPDGTIKALIGINNKEIKGYSQEEIERQLEPNLVSIEGDPFFRVGLRSCCLDAKAECLMAGTLGLPKTGGLYIRAKDGNYTPQPWPPGYNPQRQSGLTLG